MPKLRNLQHRNGCFQWPDVIQVEQAGLLQTLMKYARLKLAAVVVSPPSLLWKINQLTVMSYLLDTGFLYALLNNREPEHSAIVEVIRSIHSDIILPIPVITEIAYLLKRDLGTEAAADFIASLSSTPLRLLVPEPDDYQRAAELMRQYADANLDFVDALIAALAERLNIRHILTLDQRDFRLIRPLHCDAFEILP